MANHAWGPLLELMAALNLTVHTLYVIMIDITTGSGETINTIKSEMTTV